MYADEDMIDTPVEVSYNIAVTGLSVAVALVIGTIELGGLIAGELGARGAFWMSIERININTLGFIIVGMFILTWVIALATWRYGRVMAAAERKSARWPMFRPGRVHSVAVGGMSRDAARRGGIVVVVDMREMVRGGRAPARTQHGRACPHLAETGLTDGAMVRACRRGDAQAWGLLVQRFSRYVSAIAAGAYGLSAADTEDVSQEVFARTYEHLDRLRCDEAIRPWIGQLTRRLAIDRHRAGRRELIAGPQLEALAGSADRDLERIEVTMSLRTAMATLPDDCQEILDRFFVRDQSYREIADALEIPMGTIASRISRALGRLRAVLDDPRV